uniref:Uncharacterized protein n=1 Tax=Octopus bimaculoides TaxID=37653 RepID=A0A0L8HD67_OCTBM
MAERGRISPIEAVFWYNMSPRAIFRYEWRHPCIASMRLRGEEEHAFVQIGEEVWVKPPNARCTSQWGRGTITSINSKNNVSVDGMPRHVLDVRKIVSASEDGTSCSGQDDEDSSSRQDDEGSAPGTQASPGVAQRPQRERYPPPWLADYETN